jgi:hypothetical protein
MRHVASHQHDEPDQQTTQDLEAIRQAAVSIPFVVIDVL